MTTPITSIITAANGIDPLALAIVFLGLIALALIGLVSSVIAINGRKCK